MSQIYKRLNIDKGRIFVFGDLHGCYDLLLEEMNRVKFDEEVDTLISVGDLIDRGTQNLEALRLVNNSWFHMVIGNHEQMALDREDSLWRMNGGEWFFQLNKSDLEEATNLLEKVREFPYIIEITKENSKFVIAHGDYPEDVYEYGKLIDTESLIWKRSLYHGMKCGADIHIEGIDLLVLGHTPVEEVVQKDNVMFIDIGSCWTDKLVLVELK